MNRRILSVLLSLTMLLGLLPTAAMAEGTNASDPYAGYTSVTVTTQDELESAITAVTAETPTVINLSGELATYRFPTWKEYEENMNGKTIVFKANGDKTFDATFFNVNATRNLIGADLTFDGVNVDFPANSRYLNGYTGLNLAGGKLTFKNSTISGAQYLYVPTATFTDCVFNNSADSYSVCTYGAKDVTFTDCTFNTAGKAILCYHDSAVATNVTLTNCTFKSDASAADNKAAVETGDDGSKGSKFTITFNNCTADGFVVNNGSDPDNNPNKSNSPLWGNKNSMPNDRLIVTIDGLEVTDPKAVAADEIDNAADAAKDAIDQMPYLTNEQKAEYKEKIDDEAEKAKEAINAATDKDGINAAKDAGLEAIQKVVDDATAANKPSSRPSSSSSSTKYPIIVEESEDGEAESSRNRAERGDTVTITVKPDEGYELDTLIVTDSKGNEIEVKEKNGKFTFTMPRSKVTVEASFAKIVETMAKTFSDVPADHPFADAVAFAAANGIIEGYANGTFGVANPATVNAAVVVVARTMGQEFYGATSVAKATAWAAEMELTTDLDLSGYVTREVYMILLWRAAGMPMADLSVLNQFSDVSGMSDIGRLAMAWAVENGLIEGYSDGTVRPDGQITRGAMAAIAQRFIQLG